MAAAQALSLAGQAVLSLCAGARGIGVESAVVRCVCTSELDTLIDADEGHGKHTMI